MALIRQMLAASAALSLNLIAAGCQTYWQRPVVAEVQQPQPRATRAAPVATPTPTRTTPTRGVTPSIRSANAY
jgi:hypothetical protein